MVVLDGRRGTGIQNGFELEQGCGMV